MSILFEKNFLGFQDKLQRMTHREAQCSTDLKLDDYIMI